MTDSDDARVRGTGFGGDNVVALASFRDARRARHLSCGMATLGSDARAVAGAGRVVEHALRRLSSVLTLDDEARAAAAATGTETRRVTDAIESGDLDAMLALQAELLGRRDGSR